MSRNVPDAHLAKIARWDAIQQAAEDHSDKPSWNTDWNREAGHNLVGSLRAAFLEIFGRNKDGPMRDAE